MPAKAIVSLILIVIAAAGISVFAAGKLGLPLEALALGAAISAVLVYLKRRKA